MRLRNGYSDSAVCLVVAKSINLYLDYFDSTLM